MNESEKTTGAEEYVQAEISLPGLESPGVEKEVRSTLEALPGVRILFISPEKKKASVCYDPLLTTKADLAAALAHHGEPCQDVKTEDVTMYGHPEVP